MQGWWTVPVVMGLAIAAPAWGQVYRVETVLTGLERPWGMAWLPDGTLLVTERPGRLRAIRGGVLDPAPIAGVPQVLAAGQGGLLDVTVHPNFANNRWVYLSYASGTPQRNRLQVARGVWDGRQLRNLQVILETSPWKSGTQHFGSRFTWLPDRTLLISVGDGGNPPVTLAGDLIRMQAQNGASHLGKVLRIRDDGSVPPDNPFANQGSFDAKVWSLGHRNIQGKAMDPQTRVLWATEHGSRGGDEVNRLAAGQNFGWPVVSQTREYTTGEPIGVPSRSDMVNPLWVWPQAIAPSGLVVYRGNRFPQWQGQLFAGGLVSQSVHRLEVQGNRLTERERIAIGQRVRDVRQGPDGLLYILTDNADGRLVRLVPAS
ncbi:MAG TPA: hypothetical protein DCQ32_06095 [Cyanobacteria bacterium UBA8156]|nr:hypothetical protein [Cyanobacteria bacterium UBA8156]